MKTMLTQYGEKIKGVFSFFNRIMKRSGITYAYENQSFWDKDLKRSRSKRTLIGRVDKDTGEIVPTDGRCKKRSPSYSPAPDEYPMPKTRKEMRAEIQHLLSENRFLKEQLRELRPSSFSM